MVSSQKIAEKLIALDEFLLLLKEIGSISSEAFLKDKILIGSAKYYLQVSIECCLDIANHIIASERFRAPKDYADSFKILEEMNIVPGELSQKLQQMAKFRNRLVHLYGEIDNQYVYDFMREDIDNIREFRSMIKNRYLQSGLNGTE
ncbi:DUF86 domain-containing protein [Thiocapsa sp.]|uniref:type VII toxin-antitoxin system HepT family RNase toxin n=1 Tax=Thiocapsa sp. TaxID=2024551 RepID=UPI0025EAEDF1|nr:DUF86 domain-containing protein [Thiocapsa sp.]